MSQIFRKRTDGFASVATLKGHTGAVSCVQLDATKMVSGSDDGRCARCSEALARLIGKEWVGMGVICQPTLA